MSESDLNKNSILIRERPINITVDLNDPESCEAFNRLFETPEQMKGRHAFIEMINNPDPKNISFVKAKHL